MICAPLGTAGGVGAGMVGAGRLRVPVSRAHCGLLVRDGDAECPADVLERKARLWPGRPEGRGTALNAAETWPIPAPAHSGLCYPAWSCPSRIKWGEAYSRHLLGIWFPKRRTFG